MTSRSGARRRSLTAALLSAGAASPEGVADAVMAAWGRLDDALHPIIGSAGVAALYLRCLHLRAPHHPALATLAALAGPSRRTLDVTPLRDLLAGTPAADAAELGSDLLLTFNELLVGMVGDALTERLLRPVWAELSGDMPSEDDPS